MSTYLPTLKQLQYLVALKDHGHFGRAAEACFVTQSTLSAGLRELESLIGITLVERTRRVVRFTPLGLRIAEKAQRILREAEELSDMARAAGGMPQEPPLHVTPASIEEDQLLLLEDGHCLKDHALAACNRPELRAEATMMGTSLHTLVQMVDNGLGMTMIPEMAVNAGILQGTDVVARPLDAEHPSRRIALIWRKGSPREKEFRLLAEALRKAA